MKKPMIRPVGRPKYKGKLPFPRHEHNLDEEEVDYGEVDDFGRAVTDPVEMERLEFLGLATAIGKAPDTLGTTFPSIVQVNMFKIRIQR